MQLLRTSNQDEQFVALTRQLDDELRQRYGELQDLYTPHNRLDCIDTALLGVVEGQAVACGCFKWLDGQRAEVKRMFVHPQWRRRGYSEQLLRAPESWALELGSRAGSATTAAGNRPPAARSHRPVSEVGLHADRRLWRLCLVGK